jgi:hypothetical protein
MFITLRRSWTQSLQIIGSPSGTALSKMLKLLISRTLPLYNNGLVISRRKNRDCDKFPIWAAQYFFTALHPFFSPATLCRSGLFSPKGESMQIYKFEAIILASALAISMSAGFAVAQDGAKQDMKAAGTDTKNATKDVGNGVATGTKKTYNATANGTRTVAHKTASGTKTAADKTADGTKTVGKDVGHGTKVAAQDTAHGTEKLGDKIAGKPTPQ